MLTPGGGRIFRASTRTMNRLRRYTVFAAGQGKLMLAPGGGGAHTVDTARGFFGPQLQFTREAAALKTAWTMVKAGRQDDRAREEARRSSFSWSKLFSTRF